MKKIYFLLILFAIYIVITSAIPLATYVSCLGYQIITNEYQHADKVINLFWSNIFNLDRGLSIIAFHISTIIFSAIISLNFIKKA